MRFGSEEWVGKRWVESSADDPRLLAMNLSNVRPVALFWLHTASIIAACVLIGLSFSFDEATTNTQSPAAIFAARIRGAAAIVSCMSVMAGFGYLATKSGLNESRAVAASTVLVFVLFLFLAL